MGRVIVENLDAKVVDSFFMLLNFMKVDESWSFVYYLCCESPSLPCINRYYWPQVGKVKVYTSSKTAVIFMEN